MPKIEPVIRLIRMNDSPAANAPPARSFAQLPPIANANNKCRFPMMAQPIFSTTPPVVTNHPRFSLINGSDFPILIINPAAGITAITTISAFPNFCQNSKLKSFLIPFIFVPPIFFDYSFCAIGFVNLHYILINKICKLFQLKYF